MPEDKKINDIHYRVLKKRIFLTSQYELLRTYILPLPFIVPDCRIDDIQVKNNILHIEKGFIWDGSSGWTIDTENTIRASLVHDALCDIWCYYAADKNFIFNRHNADELFYSILREDGMSWIRARLWRRAVKAYTLKQKIKYGVEF